MLLIALAVRLDSSGPVIYWQERIGRGGRQFRIAKFRSMLEQAGCDGPKFACQVEDHITSVGRFLRMFHLDELPQLWNVLKGEMSLVGPRPEQPEFVQQYSQSIPLYQYRHIVKPGITGWAQIKRGYTSDIEGTKEKLWFDLNYISQLSLGLDIKILLQTFVVVITQADNGHHLALSSTEPRGIYVNLCPERIRSKKFQPFLRCESAMEVKVLVDDLS